MREEKKTVLSSIKFLPERTVSSIAMVLSLAVILVILAAIQYHWTGQVSQAERERMQTGLATSTNQFRQEFNAGLQQLGILFQPDNAVLRSQNWQRFAEICTELLNGADGRLVGDIYLWVSDSGGNTQVLKLSRHAKVFETGPWPPALEMIRDRFNRTFSSPERLPAEVRPFSWIMIPRIPMLIHPLLLPPSPPGSSMGGGQFFGYLMLELSLDYMQRELFPELALKHFGGPDGFIYQVAIIRNRDQSAFVYRSNPNLSMTDFTSPDARMSLLENPRGPFGRRGAGGGGDMRPPPEEMLRSSPIPFGPDSPRQGRSRGGGPALLPGNDGDDWELLLKHRQGSLEAVVAGMRRRNLGISFGILLLLAFSMGLIIAFTQRTQRLARLQMDFVAGVSHELRTPLAVICSAGDNLADSSVADSSQQVRQYGELIRNEGWKLARMVEQILHVASVQSGRKRYSLHPERIEKITETALEQVQPMIEAAGFSVERNADPELPRVNVDASALSQSIQNLVQNALKYSGESRWLAVRIGAAQGRHGSEVQLVVEDRGIGIDPADLPHIFDPFYRGRTVTESQIHGTGLGLFMVRDAVVAMGGRISVKSSPGKGSVFTIHLPALQADNAAGSPENDEIPEAKR